MANDNKSDSNNKSESPSSANDSAKAPTDNHTSDDPFLWPSRHIAEYAYCPRLFYYMQVEGIFIPSHDTEQGKAVHKRVDRPSVKPKKRASSTDADEKDKPDETPDEHPDKPESIRSLTLSSTKLELIAKLDLAEINESNHTAIPIEYRKGRPQHIQLTDDQLPDEIEPGDEVPLTRIDPWPTDRVQIGLQTLLLEEQGYTVPHAILYYASEKRKLTITVDDDLRNDALSTLKQAINASQHDRPLPLINSPKCPRCSLQPICLPDEIQHQRMISDLDSTKADGTSDIIQPRRMWPVRDDGLHIVAQKEGVRVGVRGQSLRFTDRDGKKVRDMPLASIESLAVVGSVQVSTQAIHVLAGHDIPIVFMTAAGRTVTILDPLGPTTATVRKSQILRFEDDSTRLALAQALVVAKITNQRTILLRNTKDTVPKQAFSDLNEQIKRAGNAPSLNSLLGHEGQAAAIYFKYFPNMIRDEILRDLFQQNGRKRRPPTDPINAVLSFGYAMLTHECTTALRLASLEPSIGGYHTTRPGRPSLSLDLMEPFRPLIADSIAISAVNRGELTPGHFNNTAAGCAMTDHGRKAFFQAWGRRMATEVSHPVFDYRLSYRRMLMLHARLIAAWLLDEAPTLAFLTTR